MSVAPEHPYPSVSQGLIAAALCLAAATGVDAERGRPAERGDARAHAERHALDTARALADVGLAYDVVIVDPEFAGDPEALGGLDAFTVREADGRLRPKIYVNRQSPILREASSGSDFYVKVLAAVLVHETAHLKGADETGARLAERRFLEDLIRRSLIAEADGVRYLDLLRRVPKGTHIGER